MNRNTNSNIPREEDEKRNTDNWNNHFDKLKAT